MKCCKNVSLKRLLGYDSSSLEIIDSTRKYDDECKECHANDKIKEHFISFSTGSRSHISDFECEYNILTGS